MHVNTRRRLPLGLAVAALLLLVTAALAARSPEVRDWLWRATGEEDLWEGAKGIVALMILESTGAAPDLAPDEPIDHLGVNPYGANTFLQLEADPENVRRSLALVRDAGIGWVRQEFPWEDIEIHARGDYEDRRNEPPRSAWEKYDRIVALARGHHVDLLVRLDNPPAWAYANPEDARLPGPPDDLADFGDFVAAVVERYCGRVRYYQIWNEPNIYPEWGEQDVDPDGYAALLAVASRRAREACDDVVIVSAALAQTTEPGGRNMDDLSYLEALYQAGWAEDFDVLAVQAFGLWTGPTDHRVSPDRTNFVRPLLARDTMVRYGDGEKPVWVTEMGWDSPPPEMPAPYGRTSEEARARYTVAAYERIAAEWPWMGAGFLWFFRRPDWAWHERPEGFFRLVEPDWTLTPTYEALSQVAARRPPVMNRGRHRPDDWALAYAGPWGDVPEDGPPAHRVGMPDAEAQFAFRGTGFRVELAEAPPEATLPELFLVVDQDRSALVPVESEAGRRFSFGRSGLENGEHLVIVRVDSGEMLLREILIEAPDPPSVLGPVWRAGGLVLIILVGLGAFALRRRLWRPGPRTA